MPAHTARGTGVRVDRVYTPRGGDPWARVLVDRLWPRGLTHQRADLDWWCKDISPSTELRHWYHTNDQFLEFRERYRAELLEQTRQSALNRLAALAQRRGVVLLTSTRNTHISQAEVIRELIESDLIAQETGQPPGVNAETGPDGSR
jgi:uncharacterized protein YeaO (DUF488 family)